MMCTRTIERMAGMEPESHQRPRGVDAASGEPVLLPPCVAVDSSHAPRPRQGQAIARAQANYSTQSRTSNRSGSSGSFSFVTRDTRARCSSQGGWCPPASVSRSFRGPKAKHASVVRPASVRRASRARQAASRQRTPREVCRMAFTERIDNRMIARKTCVLHIAFPAPRFRRSSGVGSPHNIYPTHL